MILLDLARSHAGAGAWRRS